jgi:hypothetical protein
MGRVMIEPGKMLLSDDVGKARRHRLTGCPKPREGAGEEMRLTRGAGDETLAVLFSAAPQT